MPRKNGTPQKNKSKLTKNVKEQIDSYLGEESDTSTYRTVSTDGDITQYSLDFTHKAANRTEKQKSKIDRAGASTSKQSDLRSPLRQSNISQISPRRSSPRKQVLPPSSPRRPSKVSKSTKSDAKGRKQKRPTKNTGEPPLLKEIRKLQTATDLLVPKLPFSRLFREILSEMHINNYLRVTPQALQALQEAAECYLTILFQDSYRCTLHRHRKTLIVADMQLVRFLRGPNDPGNH